MEFPSTDREATGFFPRVRLQLFCDFLDVACKDNGRESNGHPEEEEEEEEEYAPQEYRRRLPVSNAIHALREGQRGRTQASRICGRIVCRSKPFTTILAPTAIEAANVSYELSKPTRSGHWLIFGERRDRVSVNGGGFLLTPAVRKAGIAGPRCRN